ncbi:MAG: hypothetical protein HN411_04810 [Waddliaceae bacterium]|jgi:hypothetical protein|nr:hypothetical protein [Waddliaceae bacterium]MBT3579258.1 hypothetical protein [Waddliaceae bacterium]MBT4445295.1 hypothetical protein [Waddliaceae bacterium]MBT6928473.1 hypothetical protein [Waddliaceae bacterium]MBT7264119.1 hypothetical protein [Waddliaceae bacterium]
MRASKLFFSAIMILFATVLLAAGVATIMLPSITPLRDAIITAIEQGSPPVYYTGLSLIALAITIFVIMLFTERKLTIRTVMGDDTVAVENSVISGYIEDYWNNTFPEYSITTEVIINRKGIEIIATFKTQPTEDEEELLATIEQGLTKILGDNFGYTKPFIFTIRFLGEGPCPLQTSPARRP